MRTTKNCGKMFFATMSVLMLAFGLVLEGCGDPDPDGNGNGSGGTSNNGGTSYTNATTLVNGVLTNGTSISKEGEVDWYKFEATNGETFILSWDDKGQGSNNYTCDIRVSVYGSDGSTVLNDLLNIENGYSSPFLITPAFTGTVYIKVEGQYSTYGYGNTWNQNTGTYAIKLEKGDSNDSRSTATALTFGGWKNDSDIKIWPEGEIDWYKFEATSGETYLLSWDDKGQGSNNYTCDIRVSVYGADGSTILNGLLNIENGYSSPILIAPAFTGTVYIKIEGQYSTYGYGNTWNQNTGTYAIKLEKGDSNDSKDTATALTSGEWKNDSDIKIWPKGEIDWYKFEATSGEVYTLTWDDSGDGSENYTCDIRVSVYGADGSTVLNGIINTENGYSSPKNISGYTGTVYIKVEGQYNYYGSWNQNTGTYAIKYAVE